MNTFRYNGHEFPMFDHPYNATLTNERAVEIPIALDFMDRQDGDIYDDVEGLEVGHVLHHYTDLAVDDWRLQRRIVDRYEVGDQVDNIDVFAIQGSYDWIVSVSTLEHVRAGEPGSLERSAPWGAVAALAYLTTLLNPGGQMLVTLGLGQNAMLDRFLMRGESFGARSKRTLVRERPENQWRQTDLLQWEPYGPTHGANAVWIGEWGPT